MTRFPHSLYVLKTPTDSVQDANLNWIEPVAAFELVGECREEPNGSGRTIPLTDGQAFLFSSIIYLPVPTATIKVGSSIRVDNADGQVRFTGKIARISIDRKHARIWS